MAKPVANKRQSGLIGTVVVSNEARFERLPKLQVIVNAVGASTAARMLGVDKSLVSRVLRGHETLSAEIERRIDALD
ncbi:MAG: hypothetical protein ABR591_05645 [Candidatus Velthaea sp.]